MAWYIVCHSSNRIFGLDFMSTPLVSVILCTKDRAQSLERCLKAFRAIQSSHAWELIIVDNGSSDSTPDVVERARALQDMRIIYVHEKEPGKSRAGNTGLMASCGNLLLFTDDDCYPAADFIDAAVFGMEKHGVDYFGGRVLLYDPEDAPFTIRTETEARLIPPGSVVPSGLLFGANMGFRRSLFEKIGGFNELLGVGTPLRAAEDTELFNRASAAGFSGGYIPEPTVHHHHGRKPADIPALSRTHDIGRGGFYTAMVLSSPTPLLYAKDWYWRTRYPEYTLGRMCRELKGSLFYTAHLLAAKAFNRQVTPTIAPLHE